MSETISDKKDKKNKNISDKTETFFKEYGWSLLCIPISVFTIGTIGLYMTKVAQSNMLPRSPLNAPFTSVINELNAADIYYNNVSYDDVKFGKSMFFDQMGFLNTYKTSNICNLKKAADNATSVPNVANYMSNVTNSMTQFNSNIMNKFFLNLSILPEWSVMLIYGLFWYIFVIILFVLNYGMNAVYQIYYLFNSLYENSKGEKIYEGFSTSISEIFTRIGYKVILYWGLFIGTFISIFSGISALITTFNALFTPLFVKYKTSSANIKYAEQNNIYNFIKDILYYKQTYFLMLTLVSLTYSYTKVVGMVGIIPGIIVALLVYYMGYLSDKSIIDTIVNNTDTTFTKIASNYNISQSGFGKKLSVPFNC